MSSSTVGYLNDLWFFNVLSKQWSWQKGSANTGAAAILGVQGTSSVTNVPAAVYNLVGWNDSANNLWQFGGWGSDGIGIYIGSNSDLWKMNLCDKPPITASGSHSVTCAGAASTLFATGAYTYTWSTSQQLSNITISPMVTTIYSVTGTDISGCNSTAVVIQNVAECLSLDQQTFQNDFLVYPNPSAGQFHIEVLQHQSDSLHLSVINTIGQVIYEKELIESNLLSEPLSSGIYICQIISKSKVLKSLKLIIE